MNILKEQTYIIEAECWNCNNQLNVAVGKSDLKKIIGGYYGTERFSDTERELAEAHNMVIEKYHSGTMGQSYDADTCTYCNNFVRQHDLLTEYLLPATYGDYEYKVIDL
ncbi:hypothetical protein [Flavobacterium beibuense]|uniref:Uncharacterized protein n=1 Tax=Flavobacterium beibuense TaxID=657326 RepID=A0A444WEK9_9FLAO|nr:hypothetical protein [Flavobacterium beibuense]RYJ44291.1 hypothetical protein NU09_0901 [Flavobacterium beibuense]